MENPRKYFQRLDEIEKELRKAEASAAELRGAMTGLLNAGEALRGTLRAAGIFYPTHFDQEALPQMLAKWNVAVALARNLQCTATPVQCEAETATAQPKLDPEVHEEELEVGMYEKGLSDVRVIISPSRCSIRVWNVYTRSWWRTDLCQETPLRADSKTNEDVKP